MHKIRTMKKIFSFVAALLLCTGLVQAQRYAIIDTKYILDKLPDYKEAQKKLEVKM